MLHRLIAFARLLGQFLQSIIFFDPMVARIEPIQFWGIGPHEISVYAI